MIKKIWGFMDGLKTKTGVVVLLIGVVCQLFGVDNTLTEAIKGFAAALITLGLAYKAEKLTAAVATQPK